MTSDPLPFVRLDNFLKLVSAVGTGGEAKVRIQSGEVLVDGVVETRRGRKLRGAEVVELGGESFTVEFDDPAP